MKEDNNMVGRKLVRGQRGLIMIELIECSLQKKPITLQQSVGKNQGNKKMLELEHVKELTF